jgi:hypothetical protein
LINVPNEEIVDYVNNTFNTDFSVQELPELMPGDTPPPTVTFPGGGRPVKSTAKLPQKKQRPLRPVSPGYVHSKDREIKMSDE